jgi:hypothetical protein
MASTWLTGAHAGLEGPVFPGLPGGRAATLVLRADGPSVQTAEARAELPWAEAEKAWSVAHWDRGNYGGDIGVAIRANGPVVRSLQAVLVDLRSLRSRLLGDLNSHASPDEIAVLLFTPRVERPHLDKERAALRVLCRVLADRPDLRHRLNNVQRMDALLTELCRGAIRPVGKALHLRRRQVDIRTAMNAVGLVHRYDGRPLPDESATWTRAEAVDAVLAYIASNRFAAPTAPTRTEVTALLSVSTS